MPGQIANYTQGFSGGVAIRGVPILQTHSGQVFWVSSATPQLRGQVQGSNQNKGDFNRPFGTVAYAMTQCLANRGDVIYVKPGHTETITAAGTITHVAGVAVVGLGQYNLRPKFTFTTAATASWLMSGANGYVQNLWCVGGFSNVVAAFNVTATGCTVDNVRFTNSGVNLDFLSCVNASGAANTADGLTVMNCNWTTIDTDDLGMVLIAAACNDVTIWNNHMVTTAANVAAGSCSNLLNCTA